MIFLEPEKTIKVGKNLYLNFTFKHQNPVFLMLKYFDEW